MFVLGRNDVDEDLALLKRETTRPAHVEMALRALLHMHGVTEPQQDHPGLDIGLDALESATVQTSGHCHRKMVFKARKRTYDPDRIPIRFQ
ncbi:hypothetical protein [Ralstonia solanacearum]|uniref:hypothetical protein n=1 Tax=Ralstonia solanacearum TaxID=305 RepID=UPI0018D0EE66|nr:hypothetical protein [Ralstonia solanacearum]